MRDAHGLCALALKGLDDELSAHGMVVTVIHGPHRQRWSQPLTDEAGVALVLTLIIVTLVAIIVLDLNYLMRVDVHASTNFRDGVKAYYLAKSSVIVVKELFSRDIQEFEELKNTLLAGGSHTLPVGEGSATVRVIDETGKINVNALVIDTAPPQQTAGAQLPQVQQSAGAQFPQARRGAQSREAQTVNPWIQPMEDLFQRLGVDPTLVGALVDWIDVDDIPAGAGGAESSYYRGLEKPYAARNGSMETIAELRLIKGFTDEVLLKLGARRVGGIVDPATNLYLTAVPMPQGGSWRVNLNTAPMAILQSLTREMGEFADAIVQQRAQHRIEKIDELQQVGVSGEALQDFQRLGTLTGLYYAVEARGTVGDMVTQVTALIRTGGDQVSQTLYWRVQ
jgi:general secretion pathway protein K